MSDIDRGALASTSIAIVQQAIANAPVQERLPARSELDLKIDEFRRRMVCATSLESKLLWCGRLTPLLKERQAAAVSP